MAEKFKNVAIKGHEFRIGKFNAMDGAFIIPKVTGLLAPILTPLLGSLDLQKAVNNPEDIDLKGLDFGALLGPLAKIPEDDFKYLQKKCLSVCEAKFKNYQPVLNDNGSFSLADLEDDALSVLMLMVHTLVHNFKDFFDGSPFSGLLSTILPSNLPNS